MQKSQNMSFQKIQEYTDCISSHSIQVSCHIENAKRDLTRMIEFNSKLKQLCGNSSENSSKESKSIGVQTDTSSQTESKSVFQTGFNM